MIPPQRPFSAYKWRWASVQMTEGLNEPPVFLGVLRVLAANQGGKLNSVAVESGLARVEKELAGLVKTKASLVRSSPERNLLRNSQQYWKALGVLDISNPITVPEFGLAVAEGKITRDEFAATVVKTFELPNRHVLKAHEVAEWDKIGLRLRPLELLLDVMRGLGASAGENASYLTPEEVEKIIVPLAGDLTTTNDDYIRSILAYRAQTLSLEGWPDCADGENDPRMIREFLLFLEHYGFCRAVQGESKSQTKYFADGLAGAALTELLTLPVEAAQAPSDTAESIRVSGAAAFIERQRAMREVLLRPKQAVFRREVLSAYRGTCLLTGERIPETLEAAHIVPVSYRGNDQANNGICLRSDIHSLFDSGHISLHPTGRLSVSKAVSSSRNYEMLPQNVVIPNFVLPEHLEWRWNYQ